MSNEESAREKKRKQRADYYQRNKEEIKRKSAEWRLKNLEKRAEYIKEYHKNNKERVDEIKRNWDSRNQHKIAEYRFVNREAIAAKVRAYQAANRDVVLANKRASYEKNREAILAKQKATYPNRREKALMRAKVYALLNKEAIASYKRLHLKNNPAMYRAAVMRRKASKLKATPVWVNEFFVSEIYDLATRRAKATGMSWHVDHIVPLRSKLVCGLHCEANLRVIPGFENLSKGNRFWPDMPQQGSDISEYTTLSSAGL